MGILGDPTNFNILKTPRTQNQQYHYSASLNTGQGPLAGQKFSPVTSYFGSSFKKIGSNDPMFNSKQVFYGTTNQDKDGFFGNIF